MSTYRTSREAPPADEDRSLMCRANGCPNLGSIDVGEGRFCRFHYGVELHHWPRITSEQIDAQAQRTFDLQHEPPPPYHPPLSQQQKLAIIAKMRERKHAGGPADQRAWIASLQARHAAGEKLGLAQRQCMEQALRNNQPTMQFSDTVGPDEQLKLDDARSAQTERIREYAEAKGIAL